LHAAVRAILPYVAEDRSDIASRLIWLKFRFSCAAIRAEISYLDKRGETKTGSTDGTRDEIRSWLNGLSDLPADSLNNFLRGVEQAGQRRLPPRRSAPPFRG